MSGLIPTIGLEVHVQLRTQSKLFSPAPNAAGDQPNTRVDVVDLGLPGTLPVINARAIALAVRAAIAFGGEVQPVSHFARKHYFYPDLPKGYQISQYEDPYCRGGSVPLGNNRACKLTRIHLEEDAGKLIHTDAGTLIDLNRAGVPLIEIVGEPEMHDPADAHAFLLQLREIVRFTGVSDGDMELGSLRCDANISMAAVGAPLGTKVEIKNLNSLKMVQRALEYEIRRQTAVLATGGLIRQETRLWNDEQAETRPMRSKEMADDYRYFPDPDLLPLCCDESLIANERANLSELPAARRERYRTTFGLPEHDVTVLASERVLGDYFESLAIAAGEVKAASNWVMTDVLQAVKDRNLELENFPVKPAALGELLRSIARGELTMVSAKQAFARMLDRGEDAHTAIETLGLHKITEESVLAPLVAAAIAALPAATADIKRGQMRALDALKGHVMRATRGRADPTAVDRLLKQQLDS